MWYKSVEVCQLSTEKKDIQPSISSDSNNLDYANLC